VEKAVPAGRIRLVQLNNLYRLTNTVLQALLAIPACNSIETLQLKECFNLKTGSFDVLASSPCAATLRHLYLWTQPTQPWTSFPNVESVTISKEVQDYRSLLEIKDRLKSLRLTPSLIVVTHNFEAIGQLCNLTLLEFPYCAMSSIDSLGTIVAKLTKLECLDMRGTKLVDSHLQNIATKLKSLRKVNFSFCHGLNTVGIQTFLALCPTLEELDIRQCLGIVQTVLFSQNPTS